MKQIWYDVIKGKPDQTRLWLESLTDLENAIRRMKSVAAKEPGDYFVVDQAAGKAVATVERSTARPLHPSSTRTHFFAKPSVAGK